MHSAFGTFDEELSSSVALDASVTSLSSAPACTCAKKTPYELWQNDRHRQQRMQCLQKYLLLEERETSISRRRLSPLLLTDGLEAAPEVFLLFVQTLGPALHVLRNLTHGERDF